MIRADLNSVKLAVRRAVLDSDTFTVSDIYERTGCNTESIRTEIQRLRSEKFITTHRTSQSTPDGEASPKRGAPAAIYQLTKDEDKLRELRKSILAFYSEETTDRTQQPTSKHFEVAKEAIDDALHCHNGKQRQAFLQRAALQLKVAWNAEATNSATDNLKARIRLEIGRIHFANKDYKRALAQFSPLRATFVRNDDKEAVDIVDLYSISSRIRSVIPRTNAFLLSPVYIIAQALKALLALDKQQKSNPLCAAITDLLRVNHAIIRSLPTHSVMNIVTSEQNSVPAQLPFDSWVDSEGQHYHLFLGRARALSDPTTASLISNHVIPKRLRKETVIDLHVPAPLEIQT